MNSIVFGIQAGIAAYFAIFFIRFIYGVVTSFGGGKATQERIAEYNRTHEPRDPDDTEYRCEDIY